MKNPVVIDEQMKSAIEATLEKGDRVELIPVKDGVKVVRIKRETIGVTAERR
jgi:hypothetical protein